ncbi:MAG TPA: glycoside hydrolase family 32 protein, partial [Agriterribacter sp.]|nr:glycoside hydrolase family 32 protein [Agriterribacter sp.]
TQHCPGGPGLNYPNTHWGHAVSRDLVHWEEFAPAIAPDSLGPIFSGSAVVDWNNSAGLQEGEEKTLVAFYTGAGYILDTNKDGVICMAYSNDKGRTWKKYAGNPVQKAITHLNRDPKVFWHEKTGKWIMAITLSCENFFDGDYRFAFFSSQDLKSWTEVSRFDMPRGLDCPDMFELPVEETNEKKWVFTSGDGTYAVGNFDGKTFSPVQDIVLPFADWNEDGGNGYAAQVFNDIPASDGRTIQIAWFSRGKYPDMPFNQQTTIPVSLTLRRIGDHIKLCRYPVKEIDGLHGNLLLESRSDTITKDNMLKNVSGELFDIQAEIVPGKYGVVEFGIRKTKIVYDPSRKILTCNGKSIPAASSDGLLRLRLLIDRTSLEIFADNGSSSLTFYLPPEEIESPLKLYTPGEPAIIKSLNVWEMKSMYNGNKK